MISSAEAVRRVLAAPAPVLLIDTCALLDLMRDPRRDSFSPDQVQAAYRLLRRITVKPRAIWLPIVQQVLLEVSDNKPLVMREAEEAIGKLQDLIERVQSIFSAHELATSAIAPRLVASQFPMVTMATVDRFISCALHVTNPRGVERDAFARVAANRAPSKKGKQAKDCLVFASYLRLATLLRTAGFEAPIVFLTTNTNDYSNLPNKSVPHPDLISDFTAAKVLYAVNFLMAERLLT
jgi:hypothetical protein